EPLFGAREQREHFHAGLAQRLPGGGEVQPPPALLEKRYLESRGELLDLRRHGGLREMQLLRGARDATQAGDGFENDELRQQPVAKVTTQLRARHLGSFVRTEVSL